MKRDFKREWWSFARTFSVLPPAHRDRLLYCRTVASNLRRIAKLHPRIGETLDEMGAPLRVYVFIAYAPDRIIRPLIAGQHDRFHAILAFHKEHEGRWPFPKEITAIREKLHAPPKVEPTPKRVQGDLAACFAIAAQAQDPELAELLKRFSEDRKKRSPPGVAKSP